jgi:hypothetical protein
MREQHLDLFSTTAGNFKLRCRGKRPRHITGIFVDIARDLPHRIRAAPRLEMADAAILLAGKIQARSFGGDAGARLCVGSPELNKVLAFGTGISFGFSVEREVRARKRAVSSRGLVANRNVRRDLLLFDEPAEVLRRAITASASRPLPIEGDETRLPRRRSRYVINALNPCRLHDPKSDRVRTRRTLGFMKSRCVGRSSLGIGDPRLSAVGPRGM